MIEAKAVPFEKKMTVGKVVSFVFAKIFKEISAVGQWLLLTLLVVLINIIPLALLVFSIGASAAYLPTGGSSMNPFENANLSLLIPAAILMLVVFVGDIVFGIFSTAWFNRLGLDAFDGIKRVFGERFKLAMKETWRLIAPILLLSLVGIIIMIPYYIVSAMDSANAVMTMDYVAGPFSSPLATLFYFAGMIGAYYVSIKTVASYGILLENPEMQVMDCFKESFAMTKGRGWRIFGYYITFGILLVLLFIGLIIPIVIVWVVVSMTEFNIGVTVVAVVLSTLLYMLILAFATGTQGLFTAVVYKYLMIEHSEDLPTEVGSGDTTEDETEL